MLKYTQKIGQFIRIHFFTNLEAGKTMYIHFQRTKENDTFKGEAKEKLFHHILAQKIFVISKLVDILHLTQDDFESEDLRRLDPNVAKNIFGVAFRREHETHDDEPSLEQRSSVSSKARKL